MAFGGEQGVTILSDDKPSNAVPGREQRYEWDVWNDGPDVPAVFSYFIGTGVRGTITTQCLCIKNLADGAYFKFSSLPNYPFINMKFDMRTQQVILNGINESIFDTAPSYTPSNAQDWSRIFEHNNFPMKFRHGLNRIIVTLTGDPNVTSPYVQGRMAWDETVHGAPAGTANGGNHLKYKPEEYPGGLDGGGGGTPPPPPPPPPPTPGVTPETPDVTLPVSVEPSPTMSEGPSVPIEADAINVNIIYGMPIYGKCIWAGPLLGGLGAGLMAEDEGVVIPDHYEILFYNKDGVLIRTLLSDTHNGPLIRCEFELTNNGCGKFSLTLERGHDINIEYGQRVDIKLVGTTLPWYSGYIQTMPIEGTTAPEMDYSGYGFFNILDTLVVNKTYQNEEIADIVKDIIETYVDGRTPVHLGAVYNTDYEVTNLHFDYVSVKEALKKLSEFAVNFIYGVDEYRGVFFKPISTEINEKSRLWVGHHITSFLPEEDVNTVVNKIIVLDKDTVARATVSDSESIDTYGIHEKAMTLPNTEEDVDAVRWGNSQLERLKDPKRTAKVVLNNDNDIIGRKIKAERYAMITSVDGEIEKSYPIKKVKYKISGEGITMAMELGEYSKDISEYMLKLERHIKDLEMSRRSQQTTTE